MGVDDQFPRQQLVKRSFDRRTRPFRGKRRERKQRSDARFALSQAYTRFNSTVEPELIDASIYEINAIESRYNYLLRVLKQQNAAAAYQPLTEGGTTWI